MTDEHQPDAAALAEAADRILDRTAELAEQVELMRTDLATAQAKAEADVEAAKQAASDDLEAERRDRRAAHLKFTVVIALLAVLSAVSLGLWYGQHQTNRRLADSLRQNYVTAQQQAQTRVAVLCPLYEVLLASVDPAKRAQLPPEQQAKYDAAVLVIRRGYTTLGCQPPLPSAMPTAGG